jgi:hypothetical protein
MALKCVLIGLLWLLPVVWFCRLRAVMDVRRKISDDAEREVPHGNTETQG